MYPVVFSNYKQSAWLEASRTEGLCVFFCWVKLRIRGELKKKKRKRNVFNFFRKQSALYHPV